MYSRPSIGMSELNIMMDGNKEYFAVSKAVELTGLSYSYIARLCKEGKIESMRVPGSRGDRGKYMIPDHEIERLMLIKEGKMSGMNLSMTKEGVSAPESKVASVNVDALKKWVLDQIKQAKTSDDLGVRLAENYAKGFMEGFRAGFNERRKLND